ncbi:SGNH/GDSL hydrolase family protein [Ketobacter alkanivorans]|uniref:SGNH hydrolase-type esterase domain-containing protein n=1 Tax=Ketobacter alkanivorans TaxID=1917421 RepID=A0A2K9LMU0_9GAMM|nr:SGNH/GDSL hydrolase family protein [Ketobacter alkanivorans]AUM13602.1 hypothetical protein Kalk_14750 [Ketobacter alkanivorans]
MKNSAARTFYQYLIIAVSVMLIIETGLEYRHYRLGYDTPIFGPQPEQSKPTQKNDTVSKYGPAKDFPFRSEIIPTEKNNNLRIWIASASHAYGGRVPPDKIFPNAICERLTPPIPCQSINGSDNGMTIAGNIRLLRKYAPLYQPDYAILYQMSMIISDQQRQLTQGTTSSQQTSNSIMDFSPAVKLFESLSLYVHLSDYIGNNIKLRGNLKERLPEAMDQDFEENILTFIQACRELHIKPVLTTFALSHDLSNIDEMSRTEITNFVKYQAYLSPTGWIKTINHYNTLMKKIGTEQGVDVIDVGQALNGKPNYFIDYVHFTADGHHIIAQVISDTLNQILAQEPGRDI